MLSIQETRDNLSKTLFWMFVLILFVTACSSSEGNPDIQHEDTQVDNTSSEQTDLEIPSVMDIPLGSNLRFDHLSVDDGLSQNTPNCILQDSRGFMWFGTEDGLNKYDGYSFTVYNNIPDEPDSISGNWILSMLEDRSGRLWIGTKDGLNLYNHKTDQFTVFVNDPEDPTSLSDNEITAIFQDKKGILWIGTRFGGLNKFDESDSTFIRYQSDSANPNSLSSNAVAAIHEDQSGMLWIATRDNGLNEFDPELDIWEHHANNPDNPNSLTNNQIRTILEDSLGVLWIGMDGGGVDKYDPETNRFIHYQHAPEDPKTLSSDFVATIFQDRTGVIWVGTRGGGLNQYDPEHDIFNRYQNISGNNENLSNNFIISIFQDREGVLWLGSYGAGINLLHSGWQYFPHYSHDPEKSNGLSGNMIWSFFSDSEDNLWIGSFGTGVNRFDRKNDLWQNYVNDPEDSNSLGGITVSFIHQDSDGDVWLGTENGLDHLNPETGNIIHYQADPDAPPGGFANYNRSIIEKTSDHFWIGTRGGLYQFDRNLHSWILLHKHNPEDSNSLSDDFITTMLEDQNGNLWLGTYAGGINRFDYATETFTRFQHDDNDPLSLSGNLVMTIFEDSENTLWVGTTGGLDRFDPETETFIHFREEDGLPNNTVYCILEDKTGHLWFSTNKGLSKFDPQTKSIKNYDVSAGLQSNEFNIGACHQNEQGEMFFGGINGFNSFYPDQVNDNAFIPPIEITSLTINNEEYSLERTGHQFQAITLNWPVDSIEFEFAALSFANPEKNQYAYYLEGFEDGWKEVGDRRFGEYTNLPGGHYTLRVKGSNNDGIWNEAGVSIQITVVPPFWQTSWFYILMGLAVFGLGFGGNRLRVRSLESRSRELENQVEQRTSELMQVQADLQRSEMDKAISEERNRLARDLHDSVTQSIYSLTLLSEAGQRMLNNKDLEQAVDNHARLGQISQQALQEMRLLVYELRPQILQEEGLIGALEHRLAAVETRAGINARLNASPDLALPHQVEEELFHLSMEALNNALKHAGASKVNVSLSIEKGILVLIIEDNGRGFDPELAKGQGGMGLSNMIERAEKIDGKLLIHSEHDKGTTLLVQVPQAGHHSLTTDDNDKHG